MANTLEYIERAARGVDPDSPAFFELSRQYQQELNRLWSESAPLAWQDVLDHDRKRNYPQSFLPFSVPTAGTNAWQQQAKKAGIGSELRDTAKARLALYRLGCEPIKRGRTEYSIESAYCCAARTYLWGAKKTSSGVDKYGSDYEADRWLDAIVDRVREIHRLAVATGFIVPPAADVDTEVAA